MDAVGFYDTTGGSVGTGNQLNLMPQAAGPSRDRTTQLVTRLLFGSNEPTVHAKVFIDGNVRSTPLAGGADPSSTPGFCASHSH